MRTPLVLLLLSLPALGVSAQGPTITKVEPPSWFAAMPSPMLLIQGTNLRDASFTVRGAASVTRKETSANGHWVMLWLNTEKASAGTLHLTAKSSGGETGFDYKLVPRQAEPRGFSSRDVLYLIMPDRFADGDRTNNQPGTYDRSDPHAYHGGDLKGVIDHLDYLHELGVSSVWLTPILQNNPNGRDYHGYGATDMYAVDSRLGTLAEYRRLADELHRRGMKLVFDDVPNHVGPASIWATDPPMADWFHGTAEKHTENRYVFDPITDPHAAPAASLDALDGWFVNVLPDMNQENPVVAQYLLQNMIWWIEQADLDGLRIDTFQYVPRRFWQSYLGALGNLYPHLTTVGEVSGPDPTIAAFFAGGRTIEGADTHLTTPFDYPMYHCLMNVLVAGKPMSQLEEVLRQDWLYPHPEFLVPFIGNHDQVRFLSQPGATPALLRVGFGLVMTLRGMPQLYAGDEVNMVGKDDPDNRRDFPGGFPGDRADAFTEAGRTAAENTMHDWVAALGKLRGSSAALQTGVQQTVVANTSSFAFIRATSVDRGACSAEGSMLVVMNRDAAAHDVAMGVRDTALTGCRSISPVLGDTAGRAAETIAGDTLTVHLPPMGFAVYALH